MPRATAVFLCLCCLVFAGASSAAGLTAIWLSSKSNRDEMAQFQQLWQQQREQALELKEYLLSGDKITIPSSTWFVISADDVADRALLRSDYRGVVISLRAERTRAAIDIHSPRWGGVYADPNEVQMSELARAIHRDFRQLGIVFDPRSVINKAEWQRALQAQQLQLQGLYLHEGEFVERLLASLLRRSDLLLVTANSDIYASASLDNVVLQALKQGKIVVAGGDAAALSGALFTVVPAPTTRLQQALQLTFAILRGDAARFENAQRFHLLVNQQVLRSLQVDIDLSQLLRGVTFPLTLAQDDKA